MQNFSQIGEVPWPTLTQILRNMPLKQAITFEEIVIDMTKRNQQYLNVVLVLSSGIAGTRKRTKQNNPWPKEEKDEIFKHLGNCIKKKIFPGKSECLKCIEQSNGVLANRQWLVVKDCVRNIVSQAKTLQEKTTERVQCT